ncbi:hypothetical protein EV363DRAFT_891666 [Boletus edulis]|nr:hypothetical protein EV363DRAFT_891666 [Boletus edulis]
MRVSTLFATAFGSLGRSNIHRFDLFFPEVLISTLPANEKTNPRFGPKWRWVLVTAVCYDNLRMELAVNVHDLVRACLLTHRACQRRGFHTQLVSKPTSNRPVNPFFFLSFYKRSQRSQLPQSPSTEYPPHHSAHEAKFDVQVRVQRSFSFEELQSGSYFASLDESDIQFYRVYGQPVLIPSPDEVDANFVVRGAYPTADPCLEPLQNNGLHFHYPPPFSTKSYTLLNPLGENPSRSTPSAPQSATPNYDWQRVKQEPIEVRHTILIVPHYLISFRL